MLMSVADHPAHIQMAAHSTRPKQSPISPLRRVHVPMRAPHDEQSDDNTRILCCATSATCVCDVGARVLHVGPGKVTCAAL